MEAELLEPAHQAVGHGDDGEPGPVGGDVDEREPVGAGVFQPFDVVFDVSVGTHVHFEGDGIAVDGVGVVPPGGDHRSLPRLDH